MKKGNTVVRQINGVKRCSKCKVPNEINSVVNFLQNWEKISEIAMGGEYAV